METEESVIESNNKLIAEFIGLPYIDGVYENSYAVMTLFPPLDYSRNLSGLEFDFSWDWLMPVVEKIEKTHEVHVSANLCVIFGISEDFQKFQRIRIENNSKIRSVYLACVELIKWYNGQPK